MGTPRPRNRSRTSGTSGYSWMLWPRLSRTVPSLETARVRSAPAEPRLAPGLPSPASPALVERGVYVRVHPERPERVICEREKMRVSQPARAQGLESSYWALEKYCALRNFPQPGPSPSVLGAVSPNHSNRTWVLREVGPRAICPVATGHEEPQPGHVPVRRCRLQGSPKQDGRTARG